MTDLPPMSGRAFRAYFMIEDERETRYDDDPYERCDFDDRGDVEEEAVNDA